MPSKPILHIRGTLTGTPIGVNRPPGKYVYSKTIPGLGNVPGDPTRTLQVRIWTPQTPSNTPAQQPYRNRFRAGVATWHTLTPEQKETWRTPGEKIGLNRFQAFMRSWCRDTPPLPNTIWDAGLTMWLGGMTIFDSPETFFDNAETIFDPAMTAWDGV